MKLTILGSGSPEAYARRASTGYLLEIGNDRILFDCGGGVFDNLVRSGRLPSDITHLFFSHLHTDHMMDYARLVHAAWDEGAPPLKVWGPSPIARITEDYFGRDGVLSADLYARTELKPSQEVWLARGGTLPRPWPAPEVFEIKPGFSFEGNGWRLNSCEVPHAQPAFDCMAFSVESGGKKFVYSGDAAICDDLEHLSADADLLLHWCYRLSGEAVHPALSEKCPTPQDIAKMAARAGARRLLISHFRIHMDSEEGHESARKDLRAYFAGPAEIVEDLNVYRI
ncbi:MBL fold metallo-hydrolase [Hoeflea poritis]|uniref:MBL fold metallo-hydrolase n=1 Tax=Hoeflea poritis TaxID=2993659 RepID=A0ABT4VN20_9HYPH|nr:MBL fold metallo-hydrolase [Hoeflea poritis]MDA4845438.1 MBL fold metallo-hydrolase [Hoeflea poritis]